MKRAKPNAGLRREMVEIASDLIRCQSVSGPGAELEAVGVLDAILAREPRIERRLVAGRKDRPNLVAKLGSGQPGPTLLLTGHLDVVPADAEHWTHPPFEPTLINGELWGRGAVDMKGGLAGLITAFLHTARRGGPVCGELVLAATSDEEQEGRWGLPFLVASGELQPDGAIVAEPAGVRTDFDRVPVATRGSASAVVTVTTPGGHAALEEGPGTHAVSIACRLQQAIEAGFRPSPYEHWAFPCGATVIAGEHFCGGERPGEQPRHAKFSVSARLLPGARRERFLTELTDFLTPLVPGSSTLEIAFDDTLMSWASGMTLAPSHPLAALAVEVIRRNGFPDVEVGGFPAFSEGSFVAALGVPTLPAMGPGSLARAHRPDERVGLRAMETSLAAVLEIIEATLEPGSKLLTKSPDAGKHDRD